MKIALFLLSFCFSFYTHSCEKDSKGEQPFATVSELQNEVDKLRHYELFIPVKAGDMFLGGVEVQLASSYKMSLDFRHSWGYEGDYYVAYLAINPNDENKVSLELSYNAQNKDRSVITFCGDIKTNSLSELLKVTPPKKHGMPPPPPPKE